MNKILNRIILKNFEQNSQEELEAFLTELEQKVEPPELRKSFANFRESLSDMFVALDKGFSDFERMVDLRDRSISVSSREMVTLNNEVSGQIERQQVVLNQLRTTLRILRDERIPLSDDHQEQDLQTLVAAVDQLVQNQLNQARDLKMLFEEGVRIASALNFSALENQVRASVSKIAGEKVSLRIYFSGAILGLNGEINFYTCDAENSPEHRFILQKQEIESRYQYVSIRSSKGQRSLLAMIQIEIQRDDTLIARLQPLLPNISATLEIIKLMQEEKIKQHLANELQTARFVQRALLPSGGSERTADGCLEINGFYQSASECGGDWWTTFRQSDGRHIALVGDVTGHGTGSAIVCAVVKGFCESFIGQDDLTLSQMLERINRVVYGMSHAAGRAMTMIIVAIDPTRGELTYANAGHPHPLLIDAPVASSGPRTVRFLSSAGHILGLSHDATFIEKKVRFSYGDQIVLYSDGLTERIGREQAMYGENRLARFARAAKSRWSAADLNLEIVRDSQDFAMGSDLADDITSVVIRNISQPSIRSELGADASTPA